MWDSPEKKVLPDFAQGRWRYAENSHLFAGGNPSFL